MNAKVFAIQVAGEPVGTFYLATLAHTPEETTRKAQAVGVPLPHTMIESETNAEHLVFNPEYRERYVQAMRHAGCMTP